MLILAPEDARDEIHYRFDGGERGGERYRVAIGVCDNPLCPCSDAEVTFFPREGPTAQSEGTLPVVRLDIRTGTLEETPISKSDREFSRAFINDLTEEDRRLLRRIFYDQKAYLIEHSDLTQGDAAFPDDEIEGESLLISYQDVVPYDQGMIITVRGKSFFVDDLHCLKSQCPCRNVHLYLAPIMNEDELFRHAINHEHETHLLLDLRKRIWHIEKEDEALGVPASELIAALRKTPDVFRFYQKRRWTLRTLYQNCRRRAATAQSEEERGGASRRKVGRNDPCPCGSGKKYKKCCLSKDS